MLPNVCVCNRSVIRLYSFRDTDFRRTEAFNTVSSFCRLWASNIYVFSARLGRAWKRSQTGT